MTQASHAILAGRLSKPFQIHSIPAEWSVGILRRYLKLQCQKGKKSFLHLPCKDQNKIETLKSAAIGNAQLLTEPSGNVNIISTGKLVNAQIVLVEDNFHSELATEKYLLSNCAQGKSFEETY
jgi:hypothetical protein